MSAYRAALCEDEAAERGQIAGLCREILASQGAEAAGQPSRAQAAVILMRLCTRNRQQDVNDAGSGAKERLYERDPGKPQRFVRISLGGNG